MRTLFFDCFFGISGDMILGSVLEHLEDKNSFYDKMRGLKIYDEGQIEINKQNRYGICANKVDIISKNNVQLRNLDVIIKIIEESSISKFVKQNSIEILKNLALAEAKVHGVSVDEVFFHEIGAIDTIFDVVGCCTLFEILKIQKIICTKVNVGHGIINMEHGTFCVPAPAVSELLKGVPVFVFGQEGERVTPTGAAILTHFCQDFSGEMKGKIVSVGYGFGSKDFKEGNYLKSVVLDQTDRLNDRVYLLECNIDDMTGEHLAFGAQKLMEHGALDVYQTPIYMKKGRCGVKLSVIAYEKNEMIDLIFKYTTTNGIRVMEAPRVIRGLSEYKEKDGIRFKITDDIVKPEYEDVKKEANKKDASINYILNNILEE